MGGTSLEKKYGVNFYKDFNRLGLKMRNNQEKGKKYTCDSDYFKDIDTEEKAYWLGFVYADGYITSNPRNAVDIKRFGISLMESDTHHLEKLNLAIKSDYPINHYIVTQGYKVGVGYCRIIICDDKFARNLMSHGCIERKSNIVNPPTGLPEELEKHFIRGFMDANGSVVENNIKYGLSFTIKWSSTESVLKWIMNHLIKNKILEHEYPLVKRKEEHIVSSFEFGGNYLVKKYLDYIYNDASVWLDRKHDRYLKLCDLLAERENKKKRENICAYCGTTEANNYNLWTHDGEYKNKILCGKHYQQLYRYGKIIPDKSDKCSICGESSGKLTQITKRYPEYQGLTLCLKHYNQLMYYGEIKDLTTEEKSNNEQLCDVSSSYNAEST